MTKTLILTIVCLIIIGCAPKTKTEYVYIPQKCQIPTVIPPTYDNITKSDTPQQVLQKIINNYAACREYANILEKAINVCQ